jgi:hypothetical protein
VNAQRPHVDQLARDALDNLGLVYDDRTQSDDSAQHDEAVTPS